MLNPGTATCIVDARDAAPTELGRKKAWQLQTCRTYGAGAEGVSESQNPTVGQSRSGSGRESLSRHKKSWTLHFVCAIFNALESRSSNTAPSGAHEVWPSNGEKNPNS